MEVQQAIFCFLNNVSVAEDVCPISACSHAGKGLFFPLLLSSSPNMCFCTKKMVIPSLSASIFAFSILRFYLLFLAVRHLRCSGFFFPPGLCFICCI